MEKDPKIVPIDASIKDLAIKNISDFIDKENNSYRFLQGSQTLW
jgi:hypothetical protein